MAKESLRERNRQLETDVERLESLLELRDDEVALLERKFERVSDMGLALGGEGGIAEKYQRQRDDALAELNRLKSDLVRVSDMVREIYRKNHDNAERAASELNFNVPLEYGLVAWAIKQTRKVSQENHETRALEVTGRHHDDATRQFTEALSLVSLASVELVRHVMYIALSAFADPTGICYMIERDPSCRLGGENPSPPNQTVSCYNHRVAQTRQRPAMTGRWDELNVRVHFTQIV